MTPFQEERGGPPFDEDEEDLRHLFAGAGTSAGRAGHGLSLMILMPCAVRTHDRLSSFARGTFALMSVYFASTSWTYGLSWGGSCTRGAGSWTRTASWRRWPRLGNSGSS